MCGIWLLQTGNENLDTNYYNSFMKIKHRGPDKSSFIEYNNVKFGFHRLSIMDESVHGDQPFVIETDTNIIYVICNGEIYNYKNLCDKFDIHCNSGSDCEILVHLYKLFGENRLFDEIHGEFALAIIDYNKLENTTKLVVGRDPFGVRPLFIKNSNDYVNICSEMKGLIDNTDTSSHFPPGYYCVFEKTKTNFSQTFYNYYSLTKSIVYTNDDINTNIDTIKNTIKDKLIEAVEIRLMTDVPLGCLLSGGLDSSLVATIASMLYRKKGKKLKTFSIGFPNSTDEVWARKVADYIESDHTHINTTYEECLKNIENVIYSIETYDVTTIRASIMQYMLSKWISENTSIKTLLCGDGSDELFGGYLYFHNAPTTTDFHDENIKLLQNIHYFDGLRPDRCAAAHSLEMRVPYLDKKFVDYCISIDPSLRLPVNKIEKWILRSSFDDYLPHDILYRKKEAFSDGVSSKEDSWFTVLQKHINTIYKETSSISTKHIQPYSNESNYYFSVFKKKFNSFEIIPHYWTPNWSGNIKEPSARVLDVYNG
jgi:asparagine synthase (glutamine-hydrolysing)